MDPTPRQLRAFLAVAEAGGFTAAARALRQAQSAISAHVRELEAVLGAALFRRTTRRVELTAAGAAFRPRAAALLADLDAARRAVLAAAREQRLRVAIPPLLAATLLPGAMAALRRSHPALRIVPLEADTLRILDLVRGAEADLGIGTFPPGSTAGLAMAPLATDTLCLFCPAAHPLAAGSGPVPWQAMAAEPEVALTPDSALRQLVDAARAAAGLRAGTPAYEVRQIATALALVGAGLGLAALPEAAAPLAGPGLAMRRLRAPVITREITSIARPGLEPEGRAVLLQALAQGGGGTTNLTVEKNE
jgi:DNA-binding transcriptional LysR family regulator